MDDILTKKIIDPLSDQLELSEYAKKLATDARRRYAVKLLYNYGQRILPDPYCLKNGWKDDPSLWPDLEYPDIWTYLIESPGVYTKGMLKAYKSLDAYRFVVSGHVQVVEYHGIEEESPYCVLRAKVTPSQRVTEKPHQPWVYLEKESAAVYCAHCTCMAGLGEVCSHVAALLFKVEIGVRLGLTEQSATSTACKWNQTFRKQLEPMTITELQPLINGKRNKPVPSVIPTGKDKLPDHSVLESLKEVCPDAVFFSTIPRLDPEETETATETGDTHQFVKPLRDLYVEKTEQEVISPVNSEYLKSVWSNYKCTEQQVKDLESETKGQAICPIWFEQRKGRITASKAHDVLVRKESTNPNNLVQQITGSKCYNLANKKSVKWGRTNEEKAKSTYVRSQQTSHQRLFVKNVGLLIDHKRPFLAASPDGYVSCQCCPDRLLEVKCPYKHKDKSVGEIKDPDFCLAQDGTLKKRHRYYTQIQLQMSVYNIKSCDFVVYTNKDCRVMSIKYDDEFCANLIDKCENFFFNFILPELVTRKLENFPSDQLPDNDSLNVETSKQDVWCLCGEPEYGRMIECDNPDCPTQWFHYECVNIRRCPRGKWRCAECSDN